MSASADGPVKTPLSKRWQLFRRRALPLLVWLIAVGAIVVLRQRANGFIESVGFVENPTFVVAPVATGRLQGLSVEFLDQVEAGAPLALMDSTAIQTELEIAQAELAQLRAEAEAGRADFALRATERDLANVKDYRRFLMDAEDARMEVLQLRIDQEVNKIELERLDVMRQRERKLAESKIIEEFSYEQAELRYQAVQKEIEETETMLAYARERVDGLIARAGEFDALRREDTALALLQPLEEKISVQEARIRALQSRREESSIRAPAAGVVSQIFQQPGGVLLAGAPLLEITSPSARTVVAYLDQANADRVKVGAEVELYSNGEKRMRYSANIVRVGRSLQEIPLQLRRNQAVVEWGLPIVVAQLPEGVFRPGEVVDVRIRRN